jgi:putative phosphoribosyl transferase
LTVDEMKELERLTALFHKEIPHRQIKGKTVILVDDGLFRGLTARTAIQSLAGESPAQMILAVPVAPPEVIMDMSAEVDDIICLATPNDFSTLDHYYEDFEIPKEQEVVRILESNR